MVRLFKHFNSYGFTISCAFLVSFLFQKFYPFVVIKFQTDQPKFYYVCVTISHPFKELYEHTWNKYDLYYDLIYFYMFSSLGSLIGAILSQIKRVKAIIIVVCQLISYVLVTMLVFDIISINAFRWLAVGIGLCIDMTLPCLRSISRNWWNHKYVIAFVLFVLAEPISIILWFYYEYEFEASESSPSFILALMVIIAAVILVFFLYISDTPITNRRKNKSDQIKFIIDNHPNIQEDYFSLPIVTILRSANTWIYILVRIGHNWALTMFVLIGYYLRYSLQSSESINMYMSCIGFYIVLNITIVYIFFVSLKYYRLNTSTFVIAIFFTSIVTGILLLNISHTICSESSLMTCFLLLMGTISAGVIPIYFFTYILSDKYIGFVSGIADAFCNVFNTLIVTLMIKTFIADETYKSWQILFKILSSIPLTTGIMAIILLYYERNKIDEVLDENLKKDLTVDGP